MLREPQYFIENCFYIRHPIERKVLPKLNSDQQRVLSAYLPSHLNNNYVSYGMNRQSGKSTLIAGLALHQAIFNDSDQILMISPTPEINKSLYQMIEFGWEKLPDLFKLTMIRHNKSLIEFSNGSVIRFFDSSHDSCFFRENYFSSFFIQDRESLTKEYWKELLTYLIPMLNFPSRVLDLYTTPDLIATNNLKDLKTWL